MFLSIDMSKEERERQLRPLREEMARRAVLLTLQQQKENALEGARRAEATVARLQKSRQLSDLRAQPFLHKQCDC